MNIIINGLLESLKLLAISSFSIAISCGLIYYIGLLMQYADKKFNKKIADVINSVFAVVAIIITSIIVISGMTFIVSVLPFAIMAIILISIITILTIIITAAVELIRKCV